MFNSLLNASSGTISSLVLDIFIILAVVLAGSLIVYFIWEMISSIATKGDKTKDNDQLIFDVKEKEAEEAGIVSNFAFENEHTEEETKEEAPVEETAPTFAEEEIVEVNEQKAEEEKAAAEEAISDEERENAERRAYLEARRQEILRRMQEESAEEEESPVEETEEVQEEVQEEVEEPEELEPVEQISDPIPEPVVEEEEEEVDQLAEERKALEDEKEKYQAMVRELEEAKRALAAQKEQEKPAKPASSSKLAGLSLEELKIRLAAAEERLKATEKEFKQCKKEFIPLQKVWSTHERDEKKLRRKEALVAKQKVLLYGVNNYADIDEEKAKKLSEDLDLLDGLKLSVQHCEEVMKNNAERYPLLEKMYEVLKTRNEELKNDVDALTAEIQRLESQE